MISNSKPSLPSFSDIRDQVKEIMDNGRLTNFGPYSKSFEKSIQEYLEVKYCLCVSNASTGLIMVLNTVNPDSEVIVPSFTFLPTVQALTWNNLKPVFADINVDTYTISLNSIREQITSKTKAILAVNPFGNPCQISELESIAEEHNLKLFFDSAHSFGSKFNDVPIGRFGNAEVFSFSATKILPCGEGGAITTNDENLYRLLLDRRNYGFSYGNYNCKNPGVNGKISEFNAILGLAGLKNIENEIKKRIEIVSFYLSNILREPGVEFQNVLESNRSVYKDFTITISKDFFIYNKNDILNEYINAGIEVKSYFSPCIHQMDFYKKYATKRLPVCEKTEQIIFSLPIYSSLTEKQLNHICHTTNDIIQKKLTKVST